MYKKQKFEFIGLVEKVNKDTSQLKIYPTYHKELKSITDFSDIIRLYWLHERDAKEHRKTCFVTPKRQLNASKLGVFASRSPDRSNSISLSVVKLHEVEDCLLRVQKIDAYEGTSIIDIKPYISQVDCISGVKVLKWTRHGINT